MRQFAESGTTCSISAVLKMVNIVVFEDQQVEQLYPVTLSRPAYAVTCGCYRLFDWLTAVDTPVCGLVRSYLAEIQRQDFSDFCREESAASTTLLINARLVPSRRNFVELSRLVAEAQEQPATGIQIAKKRARAHCGRDLALRLD